MRRNDGTVSNLLLASPTRYYILRERPTAGSRSDNIMEDLPIGETGDGALLGLPESETDLDVSRPLHPGESDFLLCMSNLPNTYNCSLPLFAVLPAEFDGIQYGAQSTYLNVGHQRRHQIQEKQKA